MVTIDFPTQNLIELYLQGVFPSLGLGCLDSSIGTIGKIAEIHNQPDKYGILGVVVNKLTGIDIPILLKDTNTSKGTIAIVAQDPMRSDGDKQLPKDSSGKTIKDKIIVGTPFAFHYKRDAYSKTIVYRRIVDKLLDNGYKVYITDAHKLYSEEKTISIDKKGEMGLLINELSNLVNLKCVVTFGEDALNYIEDAYNNKNKPLCVNVLHPSSNNTSNWDSWIFEQAYWEEKNHCEGFWSDYAQKRGHRDKVYGKFCGTMSVEDIIVESTIKRIKEFLEK